MNGLINLNESEYTGADMLHKAINALYTYRRHLMVMAAVIFLCRGADQAAAGDDVTLDGIISHIEKKYHKAGFRTEFIQLSVLKALDITDTASGHALFNYPGMMKWEYEEPEKQSIITDGKNLWIYRPMDNQVTVGKFPSLFGGGKGAGFLSDIKSLRKNFNITEEKRTGENFILKLIPEDKSRELPQEVSRALSKIIIYVSTKDYTVTRVITHNVYGDETEIQLMNIDFSIRPDPSVFKFSIPEHTDVIQLD